MTLSSISKLLNGLDEELLRSLGYILKSLENPCIYQTDDQNVHKFKVRVSSLLGSKNSTQRLIGSEIAFVVVQNNWDILLSHGSKWSQALLHILETPANNSVLNIQSAIKALTGLFSLTFGKADLARTVATPILPSYIKALIKQAKNQPVVLNECLFALNTVLNEQSTTFRPYAKNYHEILINLINNFIEEGNQSLDLDLVAQGFVSLHKAATKGSEGLEWRTAILSVIAEANAHIQQQEQSKYVVALYSVSAVKWLDKFRLIFALLKGFFCSATKAAVQVPLSQLMAVIRQVLTNNELHSKLGYATAVLPEMEQFMTVFIEAVGESALPFVDDLVFDLAALINKLNDDTAKLVVIRITNCIFTHVCKSVSRDIAEPANDIISKALDLLEMPDYTQTSKGPDYIQKPYLFERRRSSEFVATINAFLTKMLMVYPGMVLTLRSRVDRHFLLANHVAGIEASVVSPGVSKYSIIPMAAALNPTSVVLEALVHPRLPLSQGPAVGFQLRWGQEKDTEGEKDNQEASSITNGGGNTGSAPSGFHSYVEVNNTETRTTTLEALSAGSAPPAPSSESQDSSERPEIIMETINSIKASNGETVQASKDQEVDETMDDAKITQQPDHVPPLPEFASVSRSMVAPTVSGGHENDDDMDMDSDIEIPTIDVADSDED